jgi:hypothetical protein
VGWAGTPASDWFTRWASIVAGGMEAKKNSGMDVSIFPRSGLFRSSAPAVKHDGLQDRQEPEGRIIDPVHGEKPSTQRPGSEDEASPGREVGDQEHDGEPDELQSFRARRPQFPSLQPQRMGTQEIGRYRCQAYHSQNDQGDDGRAPQRAPTRR